MKKSNAIVFIFFILYLFRIPVQAAQPDEFSACIKRTRTDRLHCQSGCGMILQGCYDEAVAAINAKIEFVQNKLEQDHPAACEEIAKKYAEEASKLSSDTIENAESRPGWLSADLKLLLAKQRLETIQLIQRCE